MGTSGTTRAREERLKVEKKKKKQGRKGAVGIEHISSDISLTALGLLRTLDCSTDVYGSGRSQGSGKDIALCIDPANLAQLAWVSVRQPGDVSSMGLGFGVGQYQCRTRSSSASSSLRASPSDEQSPKKKKSSKEAEFERNGGGMHEVTMESDKNDNIYSGP